MNNIQIKKNSALVINFIKILSMIIIVCVILSVFMYCISKNNFDTKINLDTKNTIQRLTSTADITFGNIEYASKKLYNDTYVQSYMFYPKSVQLYSDIDEYLNNTLRIYKDMNRHIESIYVYSDLNQKIFTTENEYDISEFSDKDVLNLTKNAPPGSYAFIRNKDYIYPNVISFIYKASSDNNSGEVIINVATQTIVSNIVDMCGVTDDFYIIDGNKNILYTKKEDMISTNLNSYPVFSNIKIPLSPTLISNHDTYNCFALNQSSLYNWEYAYISELNNYPEQLKINNRILIFPLIMIFLSGIIISISIAIYTYRPIKQIMTITQNPQKYLLSKKKTITNDEVNIIASKILMLISDNKELNESLKNKILLLNDAHLKMLQAQINPHFLYNVLNVLNGNVVLECGYNSTSSEMILCLSQLLRYALKTDKILVSVKNELNYLKKYICLLKYRYADQFSVIYDIDDDVLNCKILKMSLQPLVENCIEHGFADKSSGGIITISAKKTETGFMLSVSDNGIGISNFDISSLYETNENDINFNSEHIGLKSVIYRYNIVFNRDALIKIDSLSNQGTTITIEIISDVL